MTKIITGIISDDSELTSRFICHALKCGFHCFSINDKVVEVAKYLLPPRYVTDQDKIRKFRKHGCSVHRLFWTNMLLSSIPEKCKRVLITDMNEEDCVKDVMKVYRLNEKNIEKMIKEFSESMMEDAT